MRLALNPANSARDCETACLQAYEQLSQCPPGFWTALPVCGSAGSQQFAQLRAAALGACAADFPYAAIAAEAERALGQGIRAATPLALLLLAALAVGACGGADGARTLAEAALKMADRLGPASARDARVLHTALVAPFTGAGKQSLGELAALCADASTLCCAQLHLAADGFMAGMALPDLSRQVARAAALPKTGAHARAVAAALAVRARLFFRLMHGGEGVATRSGENGAGSRPDGGFGYWLTRLQAAVYDGDQAVARQAAGRAEVLAGPLLPVGDRLAQHLFGALAWSQVDGPAAATRIGLHCEALRRITPCLQADALLGCALAARAWQHGDRLGALRGFDGAGTEAGRAALQGLAVLAWQQAAQAAQASGLVEAARHYEHKALACWEQWGATGRAAALRRAGNDSGADADRQRIQRAGGIGELGLSIAHEVNQPLAAISLHAAAACMWLRRSEPDIEKALSALMQIGAAGQHAGDIVRSVQRLSSHQEMEMDSVPVDQTIADTLRLLDWPLRRSGIEVELALALGDCTIRASRVQLQQVLTNLLVNATEALARCDTHRPPRRIRVESRRCGEQAIEIAVADNGPGICPELAGRVFGSMFSTKRNGTGMGLSISLAIVHAHGGHIAYEPCAPHGACFRFSLPVRAAIRAQDVSRADPQHDRRRPSCVAGRDRCRATG